MPGNFRAAGAAWALGLCLAAASLRAPAASAQEGAPPAEVPEAPPAAAAPADGADAIEHAWLAPAGSLAERVARTRRQAVEFGVWNHEAAAHSVLVGNSGGDALERAEAAVLLAPDLPAAHMARAEALWLHSAAPIGALRTAVAALLAIPRHPEASIWFAASGLYLLAATLIAAGLLCIALVGIWHAPHAAHDLGDLVSGNMPGFARAALLGSALLVPLALGEGILGIAAAALCVGAVYGSGRQRFVLALATGAALLGAFPVARLAGAALDGLADDRVAASAFSPSESTADPVDLARLRAAADRDPLAGQALARRARRLGNLAEADAHYQRLLEAAPDDAVIANNAGNVRLSLGHREAALALYRRSTELRPSAIAFYNLSQAHGRAFQVEDLGEAFAQAQRLDGGLVAELTALQGTDARGFVADLPLPARLLWKRVASSRRGKPLAAELRARVAPGRLGGDPLLAGAALAALWLACCGLGGRLRPSGWCGRCGRRVCPRCDAEPANGDSCAACRRLYSSTESTDQSLRLQRIGALRRREKRLDRAAWLASLLIPGAAGLLAERPWRCLAGIFFFALALHGVMWRRGLVPDPLVAGASAPLAFLGLAACSAIAYAIVVATCLAARRNA